MKPSWKTDDILRLARDYQAACVLAAAAELDLFGLLSKGPLTSSEAARKLDCDPRAAAVLLAAAAALELLEKRGREYAPAPGTAEALSEGGPGNVLAMVRHQANCMRRWMQLARVVKTGRPARRTPSILGEKGDRASFIGAMHAVNVSIADRLVAELKLPSLRRLLDVGGASGTWTFAFLRAHPKASAVVFDLPSVIPMAKRRAAEEGFKNRVRFAAGDFLKDKLPSGFDLAWVSAIVHQNSRAQNRALFRKVRRALSPGGRILVRDVVMEESRTSPPAGALFAVNMLVGTKGGSTYTLSELRADLDAAGFTRVGLLRRDDGMHSVVSAVRL
ncbi:MAG: methyltransferase domain-containing protein [Elusimicrobia bacterium]|nr:methyltransferase domain-containing protein [Elusimicrobiota bacterium]